MRMRTLPQCHRVGLKLNIAVVNDTCIIVTEDVKCRRCFYTSPGTCKCRRCLYTSPGTCKCRRCLYTSPGTCKCRRCLYASLGIFVMSTMFVYIVRGSQMFVNVDGV